MSQIQLGGLTLDQPSVDKILESLGFTKGSGNVQSKELSTADANAIALLIGASGAMGLLWLALNPQVVQSAIDGISKIGSSIVPDVGV